MRFSRRAIVATDHQLKALACLLLGVPESAQSRFMLEARLDSNVFSMAMPYGRYDERLLAALDWSGYECAYTTEGGVVTSSAHPLRLPRIEVHGKLKLQAFAERLAAA